MSCLKQKFDQYQTDNPEELAALLRRFDALRALYPVEMASSLVLPLLQEMQEAHGATFDGT